METAGSYPAKITLLCGSWSYNPNPLPTSSSGKGSDFSSLHLKVCNILTGGRAGDHDQHNTFSEMHGWPLDLHHYYRHQIYSSIPTWGIIIHFSAQATNCSLLTRSVLTLILKTAGESELNANCWNRDAWTNALHCTHFACSTVTFRPLLLMKQVAICKKRGN